MTSAAVQPKHDSDPPGSTGWRSHIPVIAFGFVIACLLILAATPILMIGRLDALVRVTNSTIGVARPLAADLRLLFVQEVSEYQRYRIDGDSVALARYRAHRIREERLFTRLLELAPSSGGPIAQRIVELRHQADRWHALPDAHLNGQISEAQFIAMLPIVSAGSDSVLAASERLRSDLNAAYNGDVARGMALLNVQRIVSATLGVLAILTAIVVAWFAERERALGRELARAVAEEARLRTESERRREELERITESKARLMRGFTHDVKNPIGAADGYLQLLADGMFGPLDEKQQASIERAHRSLGAALNLISELLELATAESGRINVHRVPTDVCEIARDVAEEYRAQAGAKGLAMSVDCATDVPVLGSDPARVRQVLGNLLSNAVKYTLAGSIAVRVRSIVHAERGRSVAVEIADTGPGIPQEKQHLLFREFVRLDPAAGPGAGIGLAISTRIVEVLGGAITVASEPGRGTTFTLLLPAGEESRPGTGAPPPAASGERRPALTRER
jgi:signal transduction histidine kinase